MREPQRDISVQKRSARFRAAQACWLSLALIHFAPLISATSLAISERTSASAALNCAAVWLAFAFFNLKFLDVRWLRWRLNRINTIGFILACALAHQEVRTAVARTDDSNVIAAILVTAPSLLAGCKYTADLLKHIRALLSRSREPSLQFLHWLQSFAGRDRHVLLRMACLIPRAPPC